MLELDVPPVARVGSTVPITLRARNVSDRPVDLYLRGRTIAFDVVVRHADGDIAWRRLENEIIPAIIRLETLAPQQVLELDAEWSPELAGSYVVEGVLLTDGPDLRTDPVTLRVLSS